MASVVDEGDAGIRVVKMKLNTFCLDDQRQKIAHRVNGMVYVMNLAVAEAYTFANFHVIRCLQDPSFDVSKLPKLDRCFYYRCLLAVTTSNARSGRHPRGSPRELGRCL